MTGDAPQPGETPRTETNPWSLPDPDTSWWRGGQERQRGQQAARAREAGLADTSRQLEPGAHRRPDPAARPQPDPSARPQPDPAVRQQSDLAARPQPDSSVRPQPDPAVRQPTAEERRADPAVRQQRAAEQAAEDLRAEPVSGVERDHNRADAYRWDPLRPPAPVVKAPEQDVMILPEPSARNRPTIALEQPRPQPGPPAAGLALGPALGPAPRPGSTLGPGPTLGPAPMLGPAPALEPDLGPALGPPRPDEPLPPPTGNVHTDARLERLENSPFWLDEHERITKLPEVPELPAHADTESRRTRSQRRARRRRRKPGPALFALVTLALMAAFFAWVSAEPFWLAVGHGTPGLATTARCTGHGVSVRCTGRFTAGDRTFTADRVTLLGVEPARRAPGTVTAARMVSSRSGQAYLGATGLLVNLRWMLGFLLVLVCGYGIAGLTGVRRLDEKRARRVVLLLSLVGPVALLGGFLGAAY